MSLALWFVKTSHMINSIQSLYLVMLYIRQSGVTTLLWNFYRYQIGSKLTPRPIPRCPLCNTYFHTKDILNLSPTKWTSLPKSPNVLHTSFLSLSLPMSSLLLMSYNNNNNNNYNNNNNAFSLNISKVYTLESMLRERDRANWGEMQRIKRLLRQGWLDRHGRVKV